MITNDNFTENDYEQALIALFTERLGYDYECGYDVERDFRQPCYVADLEAALQRLNPAASLAVLSDARRLVTSIHEGTLEQRNETLMDYLQSGVEVKYVEDGRSRTALVKLIDFETVGKNQFKVVNQWSVEEYGKIRCDLVVFVNGLPLVVVELKSPSNAGVEDDDAYLQIRQYQQKCPSLFVYNAFSVTSDMLTTKAGTISASQNRYMEWKSKDGEYSTDKVIPYDTFFEGIFPKERLIDILRNFVCFDHKDGKARKVMGAYHQYFAVNKALARAHEAYARGDGKGGVFWHTQGSGKSFSMVFFVHKLMMTVPGLTVVVVTDRNDLDQQLYEQFAGCSRFVRQTPQRVGFELNAKGKETKAAEGGRADLKAKLKDLETGGIIFTTIQKFEEGTGLLSDRRNIIVITDEAHRSQYGDEHWDEKSERMKKGFARLMREALPNAVFVGFTGTPVSDRDRDTQEVFGNYIDVYDMTQAVADGATRPVYYESRVINLNLDEDKLRQLDEAFDELAEDDDVSTEQTNKAKNDNSGIKGLLCSDETIRSLCDDIVKHYEENRQNELTGKAMIVAYNKLAAFKIYKRLLELRPEWTEKVHVVASPSNKDKEEWHQLINDRTNKEYAKLFKDDASPMKIAIVVDMWLTGFDVPSLATMYVYKPMKGHNLMQAIARVNRVFPDKEGGLIVDYVGIASALREAMQDYTQRDRKRFGDPNIQTTAHVKFREKLEVCRDLLHGYDYSAFLDGDNTTRARIINGGVNFMLEPDSRASRESRASSFIPESQLLHNALTLCRSLTTDAERQEVAFMDAVRVMLVRFRQKGAVTKQEINERISQLLEQSIKSQGVINLFSDVEFSLFDESFLKEIRRMKEKNLAVQLLKKLLNDRLRTFERTSVVQSLRFSEMMNRALSNYLKGMLTNEEVIEELLKMAEAIRQEEEEGNALGLTIEEKAFYDALSSPQGVKDAYSNEEFVKLTKELTEQLRRNRTIDWNHKESARAKMRVMVKRLLKKYHYPPEGQEQALQTVMEQCNRWADDEEHFHIEQKLATVEDDQEVRNLIYNRLLLNPDTTDFELQREAMELFGTRYPDMGIMDWKRTIEAYTPMVRETAKQPTATVIEMQQRQRSQAAENMDDE